MKLLMQPGIILLEPIEDEEVRESGLILQASVRRNTARVSDIHPDTSECLGVRVGDEVLINPFAIQEITLDGTTKRLAIAPSDVLAIVEES